MSNPKNHPASTLLKRGQRYFEHQIDRDKSKLFQHLADVVDYWCVYLYHGTGARKRKAEADALARTIAAGSGHPSTSLWEVTAQTVALLEYLQTVYPELASQDAVDLRTLERARAWLAATNRKPAR